MLNLKKIEVTQEGMKLNRLLIMEREDNQERKLTNMIDCV